jgi:hypothetical protein
MGKQVKCPWCGEAQAESEVKVSTVKNDQGNVVERRCAKCHRVLAAYLEQEGDFIPKIRKF